MEAIFRTIRDSQDVSAVRASIMALGYETGDEIYPVLVEKLNDPNPGIRHAAVISLGRLGRTEAVQEIVKPKIFRSSVPEIRWAAVAAVGKLGDYRVIDSLLKAVADPEWIVRTQAVTELMGKVREVRDRRDARQIHFLVHMLSLENEEIVGLAVEGLEEFASESLAPLQEALSDSSGTVRANAARALGRLACPPSVPCLLAALQDDDWRVRAGAAEALGAIGDPQSIEPLIQILGDTSAAVQERASAALARFGMSATSPLLNALARARNKAVLKAVVMALGGIADPKSVPALIGLLRSSYFIVRKAASTALGRFGPGVVEALLPTLSFNRSDIGPLLKDAADRQHPGLQLRAVKALGALEDHRAVAVLQPLVDEGPPGLREAAMQALANIGCAAWGRSCAIAVLAEVGTAAIASRLSPSLQDDSDKVRFEAIRALGKWGGAREVKLLARMATKDRAALIRAEAIRALRQIGGGRPEVIEAAVRGLRDDSRSVRIIAADLLGLIQNKKTIPPLIRAMSDSHWSVRQRAENALQNFGSDAIRPLIAALGSARWTTRARAARLLGEIGDPRAVGPLTKALARKGERQRVRQRLAAALERYPGRPST